MSEDNPVPDNPWAKPRVPDSSLWLESTAKSPKESVEPRAQVLLPSEEDLIHCERQSTDPFDDGDVVCQVPREISDRWAAEQAAYERTLADSISNLEAEAVRHGIQGLEKLTAATNVHPDCGHFLLRKAIECFCNSIIETCGLKIATRSSEEDGWYQQVREPTLDDRISACSDVIGDYNTRALYKLKNTANEHVHGFASSMFSSATYNSVASSAKEFLRILREFRQRSAKKARQ